MGIRKKQCTGDSYCLSVPLTKEQGALQRRQKKKAKYFSSQKTTVLRIIRTCNKEQC